jgi:hypothetical protein
MRTTSVRQWLGRTLAVVGLVAGGGWSANAQTTTGSIRGVVYGTGGAPVPDAQVGVRDLETNQARGAVTNASGAYYIAGLRPAPYEVTARRIGLTPQTQNVRLLIGQTIDLNFSLGEATVTLTTVQVTASPPAKAEGRTSEVATNVTQEQINNLPSSSRNILDLATLAPGTRVSPDRINGTSKTFAAGAQAADQVNIFVDGASYKNDITQGGVSGQDASRGNPFPRNAVQEFRVATSNFKAEYQKASSAIITAVTKSGTNMWQGSAFTELQNENFVAIDTFSHAQKSKPDYARYLAGLSLGGPIVPDKVFFFGSYEGNYQNRQGRTVFSGNDVALLPARVQALNGEVHTSPFRSNLLFGKLNFIASEKQNLEISGDARRESDKRDFGNQFRGANFAYETGDSQDNRVYTGRAKHSYYFGPGTNEAMLSYQLFQWHTNPFDFTTPQFDYGVAIVGGHEAQQNLTQRRLAFRDDFTLSALHAGGTHIPKVGVNVDFDHYNMNKQLEDNPHFYFGTNNSFATPNAVRIGVGDPVVKDNNTQIGAYAQDDWTLMERLTLNLGVRWDYETNMYNRNYVTPQNVVDSLTANLNRFYIPVDPSRYFTNGSQRKNFYGGIQPRAGLSYALDQAAKTTVFGGWGMFYDRLPFNATLDETYKRQHPTYTFNFGTGANQIPFDPKYYNRQELVNLINSGRAPATEVFLVPNDLKPPHSIQWSVGARHDFGAFNSSITYNRSKSYNGYSYEFANVALDPTRNDCCISFSIPAYANILVGNNDVHTWYQAVYVKLDRPYHLSMSNWGWGGGIAYTYSKAEAEGGDLFSFPAVHAGLNGRHPISDDVPHQAVINFVSDIPYLWGIQFSGLAQFTSGKTYNKVGFFNNSVAGNRVLLGRQRGEAFKNIDFRLRKDFANVAGNRLGVTIDLFNVLNSINLGCYNETAINGSGQPDTGFGKATCTTSDPRRLQLGLAYDFQAGGFMSRNNR